MTHRRREGHMIHLRFSAALAALVLVSACAQATWAACPVNEFYRYSVAEPLQASAFDTTIASFNGVAREAYDQVAGTIRVDHPGFSSDTWFKLRDLFDVAGVPAGTVVPVAIELSAAGWIASNGCGGTGCWGYVEGKVTTPTDAQVGK